MPWKISSACAYFLDSEESLTEPSWNESQLKVLMTASPSSAVSHRWSTETQRWNSFFMSIMDPPLPISIAALLVCFHSLFQSFWLNRKLLKQVLVAEWTISIIFSAFLPMSSLRLLISEPQGSVVALISLTKWCINWFHRSLMIFWNCLYLLYWKCWMYSWQC